MGTISGLSHFKNKQSSQLRALTESVNSWKGLWEASTQEVRELKIEIKELRADFYKAA